MTMFASQTAETIPLPFAADQTATIRKLTGRELDSVQAEHLRGTIGGRWTGHGWAAVFQRQLAKGIATNADAEQVLRDPLSGYDRHAIVKAGLIAWTLDRALDVAAIEDLDDDAIEWFATEIMRRTKPGLFQTEAEAEDDQKNG